MSECKKEMQVKCCEENKSSKRKKVAEVTPVSLKNPAQNYIQPLIHKIATKIVLDEQKFLPVYVDKSSAVTLRAKMDQAVHLTHRSMVTIDCGFTMELPTGYKATFIAAPSLRNKGLIVATSTCKGRVTITVINLGREIIPINPDDAVAEMSLESVLLFDWVMEND